MAKAAMPFGRFAAEFVVIVVGVLVALYAQGWVDARGERDLAAEYLSRLSADLHADVRGIERRVTFFGAVEVAGRRTLEWLASDSAGDEDTLLMAILASERWLFPPNATTYNDLQTTGNFVLIPDLDLRGGLDNYHSLFAVRAEAWDLPEGYRTTVRGVVPLDLHARMLGRCGIAEETIVANLATPCEWAEGLESAVEAALQRLKRAPGVEEQLRFLLSEMVVGTRLYESQLRVARRMAASVDEAR